MLVQLIRIFFPSGLKLELFATQEHVIVMMLKKRKKFVMIHAGMSQSIEFWSELCLTLAKEDM